MIYSHNRHYSSFYRSDMCKHSNSLNTEYVERTEFAVCQHFQMEFVYPCCWCGVDGGVAVAVVPIITIIFHFAWSWEASTHRVRFGYVKLCVMIETRYIVIITDCLPQICFRHDC